MTSIRFSSEVLSPGLAQGVLCFLPAEPAASSTVTIDGPCEPTVEVRRFQAQIAALHGDLEAAMKELESDALAAEAQILRAHLTMLRDPQFQSRVHELIHRTRVAAETAVEHALEEMAALFRDTEDPVVAEFAVCAAADRLGPAGPHDQPGGTAAGTSPFALAERGSLP